MRCEYIGCKGIKNLCEHSGCNFIFRGYRCSDVIFPGSIYCGSHICGVYGCVAGLKCVDHACRVNECYRKVFNANAKYCAVHICNIDGCTAEKEACESRHKCIVVSCMRPRLMEYQPCGHHLSYYEIMRALCFDGNTYISILPRDIMKIIYLYMREERYRKFPYIEP